MRIMRWPLSSIPSSLKHISSRSATAAPSRQASIGRTCGSICPSETLPYPATISSVLYPPIRAARLLQTGTIRRVAQKTINSVAAQLRANIQTVIIGKDDVIDLAMVALLCEGHVLIEDVPGIGKTTLAKAIARSLNCSFKRIQFTPDLLPSDVTGIS